MHKKCARKHCKNIEIIKLFTKNIESFRLRLSQLTTGPLIIVIMLKKNYIWLKMPKSRKFYENWVHQEQRPFEEKNSYK